MALSKPLMDSLMSQYRGELSAIEAYDRALQKWSRTRPMSVDARPR